MADRRPSPRPPSSAARAPAARRMVAENRKARHDYEILETWEAGMVLSGTEVKAAREGKVQLRDSWVEVKNGEAWLQGVHISPYSHGNRENHLPDQPRKLLLRRREIDKLLGRTRQKGLALVPLEVFFAGRWLKVSVALARGKKLYDKRDAERDRDVERDLRDRAKSARERE